MAPGQFQRSWRSGSDGVVERERRKDTGRGTLANQFWTVSTIQHEIGSGEPWKHGLDAGEWSWRGGHDTLVAGRSYNNFQFFCTEGGGTGEWWYERDVTTTSSL